MNKNVKGEMAAYYYMNQLANKKEYPPTQRDVAFLFGTTEGTLRKYWNKLKNDMGFEWKNYGVDSI